MARGGCLACLLVLALALYSVADAQEVRHRIRLRPRKTTAAVPEEKASVAMTTETQSESSTTEAPPPQLTAQGPTAARRARIPGVVALRRRRVRKKSRTSANSTPKTISEGPSEVSKSSRRTSTRSRQSARRRTNPQVDESEKSNAIQVSAPSTRSRTRGRSSVLAGLVKSRSRNTGASGRTKSRSRSRRPTTNAPEVEAASEATSESESRTEVSEKPARRRGGVRPARRRQSNKRRVIVGSLPTDTVTPPPPRVLVVPTTPETARTAMENSAAPVPTPKTTATPLYEPSSANAPPTASSRATTYRPPNEQTEKTTAPGRSRTRAKTTQAPTNSAPVSQIEALVQSLIGDLSLSSSQASASEASSANSVFDRLDSLVSKESESDSTSSRSESTRTETPSTPQRSSTRGSSSRSSTPSSSLPNPYLNVKKPDAPLVDAKKRRRGGASRAQIAVPKGTDVSTNGFPVLIPGRKSTPNRAPAGSSIAAVGLAAPKPVPSEPVGKQQRKLVCYYTNWSQYRPSIGKFMPTNIDPHLCTHVVFAFSSMKNNRLSPFEHNDISKDGKPGLYDQVTGLKKLNPRLKVLLAIGGWSFGTKKFKDMSGNLYNRRTFVFSVAPYLREKNFDGLDLDWEYPKGATDKKNFAELCRELREAFEEEARETGRDRLLLTAAVPVGPDSIRSGYDVVRLGKYLDLFHIMAYDFHGKWESQVGHNAPLNAPSSDSTYRKQLSVNASLHMWMSMGAPSHKIVVGMPTYGRSFTLANPGNAEVNAPARGGGREGTYTKEEGFLAYYEICEKLYNGATYVWDAEMSVPYMIDGNQWVGFDDEKAIRIKMDLINDMDLGGAMVWSTDMDDFEARACGGARYPLISAMREELFDIPRQDNGKDVDWTRIAKRKAAPQPQPTQLSIADLLAILRAQGISPDAATVQQLQTSLPALSAARSPAAAAAAAPTDNLTPPKVLCYVTSWARDRPGRGRFTPEDLDPELCTHVVWAFGNIVEGKIRLPSEDQSIKDDDSDYQQLVRLREANPDMQIILSVGGSVVDSDTFNEITASDYRMNNFIYEAVDFLRRMDLNGLDLYWDHPKTRAERDSHARLVRDFRLAFDSEASAKKKPRLILTTAIPADPDVVYQGFDIKAISEYVDMMNVLALDLHGAWDDTVGHNAPLYPLEGASLNEQRLSVDRAVREILREGAPPEKTLLGLASYGRSFTLQDTAEFDIGAPVKDAGEPARFTEEPGFMAYFEICELLDQKNTTLIWDHEQQVPFAYNGDQWIGFDDEKSIALKVEWLRELGLGGVTVWSADLDDYRGTCGTGAYPLLHTVQEALSGYRVPYTYAGGAGQRAAAAGLAAPVDANEVVCDNADGEVTFHRDVLDCKHYYLCQGTNRHHMPCPANLVFNEDENVCDWPENVEACWAFTQAPL